MTADLKGARRLQGCIIQIDPVTGRIVQSEVAERHRQELLPLYGYLGLYILGYIADGILLLRPHWLLEANW